MPRLLRTQVITLVFLSVTIVILYHLVTNVNDTRQNVELSQIINRIQETVDSQPRLVFDVANKAILLSYMRAGTTFLGSMFEKNDDIFYVFEPEWSLIFGSLNEYEALTFIDGRKRGPYWITKAEGVIRETIFNYLYCNISAIDMRSLKGRFMNESQSTRPFYKCLRTKGAKLGECVDKMSDVCRRKPVRFLKTVRLRMELMEELLRMDPSLKIIHMIRDPRGIAISRMGWAEYYLVKSTFTFGRVCGEILRDIEAVERLSPDLTERVFPVLYEDVADNPEAMTQKLHEFLGIHLPEKVKQYVHNITHAKKDNRLGFSTIRSNSSQTAYSWRLKIKWQLCREIDRLCSRVYNKVGYLPARNEADLRNLSRPLRRVNKSRNYAGKRY